MVYTLGKGLVATGAVPTGTGQTTKLKNNVYGIAQVNIAGVASVNIEGSLDGVNWIVLNTFTSTGSSVVALHLFMRVNVTAWTSGNVDAFLSESESI